MRLAVAGAFHTDFMQPAVEKLQAALAETEIVTPRIPVISNVDAKWVAARAARWPCTCACSAGVHVWQRLVALAVVYRRCGGLTVVCLALCRPHSDPEVIKAILAKQVLSCSRELLTAM